MIAARGIALAALVGAAAVGAGFLVGYPAEIGAVTGIAFAAVASLVTARDLAAGAGMRARPARRVAESSPPAQLRLAGEALAAAQASAFGADRELRPLLRPIAAMRLARRGVDIDQDPTRACALLGEPLWGLVRADAARGSNLVSGGISAAALDDAIDRLERL